MPLLVDREQVFQKGHSVRGSTRRRSLGRIVSGMEVTTLQTDSVGLDRFMQEMSALFGQDQVQAHGAKG